MSVIEQLKELDQQREQLLKAAREEALAKVQEGIETLNQLGYHYRLIEEAKAGKPGQTVRRSTGRRSEIRNTVLNLVKQHPDGISRADILVQLDAKGDKKAEMSISNALANLKKTNQVTAEDGVYRAA